MRSGETTKVVIDYCSVAGCPDSIGGSSDATDVIIQTGPTAESGGKTTDQSVLFELRQPPYPGKNECSFDSGPFQSCGAFYRAENLALSAHSLKVKQTIVTPGAATRVKNDGFSFDVVKDVGTPVEQHTYCWLSLDEKTDYLVGPTTTIRGSAMYYPVLASGQTQKTFPNQATPGYDTFDRKVPGPFWLSEFISAWVFAGGGNDFAVSRGFGGESDNTWVPDTGDRSGAPFPVRADVTVGANRRPSWSLSPPGPTANTFAGSLTTYVSATEAPCLRLLPPSSVHNNGDGTLSATFGWQNLTPFTITAKTSGGSWVHPSGKTGAGEVKGNGLTDSAGTVSTPKGMPTAFGANSAGTWTYTFTDPLRDSINPIKWRVGNESVEFYVVQSLLTPPNPSVNPFTHVNSSTGGAPATATQQQPVRPLSVSSPDPAKAVVAPQPKPDQTGGTVAQRGKLTLTTKVVSPKMKYVKRGKKITFRSVVRNKGTVDAVGARLCEAIPRGTKFVSAPGREIFNTKVKQHKQRVCWDHSRMAPGTAWTSTLVLKAKGKAKFGKRSNVVRARARNIPTVKKKTIFHIGTKKQNRKG